MTGLVVAACNVASHGAHLADALLLSPSPRPPPPPPPGGGLGGWGVGWVLGGGGCCGNKRFGLWDLKKKTMPQF